MGSWAVLDKSTGWRRLSPGASCWGAGGPWGARRGARQPELGLPALRTGLEAEARACRREDTEMLRTGAEHSAAVTPKRDPKGLAGEVSQTRPVPPGDREVPPRELGGTLGLKAQTRVRSGCSPSATTPAKGWHTQRLQK